MTRDRSNAFSLVEILVVVTIIGVLVAMLLPAVGKVRSAAERLECANQMKQHGLALYGHHDSHGFLPPSKINPGYVFIGAASKAKLGDYYGGPVYKVLNHSGFTLLLPFLEHADLFRKYRFDYPSCNDYGGAMGAGDLANGGAHPDNEEVIGTPVKHYICPADQPIPKKDTLSVLRVRNARRGNYLMSVHHANWERIMFTPDNEFTTYLRPRATGMFMSNRRLQLHHVLDGASNTIAIGEVRQQNYYTEISLSTANFVPHWGAGHHGAVAGCSRYINDMLTGLLQINQAWGDRYAVPHVPREDPRYHLQGEYGFGSWHADGANFLFGDGSVHFLSNRIPFPVFDALTTINGGEFFDDPR